MKNTLKPIYILSLLAACLALVASGCSTTKGFGKDVEKLGEEIQGE